MPSTRRAFLVGTAQAIALSGRSRAENPRPKVAAIITVFHKYSHSQHIIDRFLEGYGWEGGHHRPPFDVVSLYVDQVGKNDLSRERASRHPEMKIYPTIARALTMGGRKLAVDGVLLVGEHGRYPANELGQTLYPRYEFFEQVVDVYNASGKTAPLYNDKHLSWSWDHAREMVDTARTMGFGLMAGSSLPVTWRQPSIDVPLGAVVEEAMGVWNGSVDGGDIHVIEAVQSLVERRRGGETGVRAVQALAGESFWKALESESWEGGGWDKRLFEACLCRSHQLKPARATYGHVLPSIEDLKRLAPRSRAYRFEYNDGLKASIIELDGGMVGDCTAAVRLAGGERLSLLFYLPYYTMRNFFSPLVHHIETFFLTGKPPYPIERTLLTTGMTASAAAALSQKPNRLETPHLAIRYSPPAESTYWRS